jgi:hypothetical protein
VTPIRTYPATKQAFRDWCNDASTHHCFYSTVEGLIPSGRVSVQNPPHRRHGLVVDYDAQVPDPIAAIVQNAAKGLLPCWASTSYSGNHRIVFEFEESVLVDNEQLSERFLKIMAKELALKSLLPGLDDSSYKPIQYFELGQAWRRVPGSNRISADLLAMWFFKAATERVLPSGDTQIPIEAVAAEVEKQFPGRWLGEFSVGSRGPLFWIADGIDRVGCQVGDFGMICYSDRAGKSFLSWSEILGRAFVRDYDAERIGAAAKGIWFDGKRYWRRGSDGDWRALTKDDTIMWLKGQGLSARCAAKETISEAEKVLLAVQELRQVKAATPVVHDSREVVFINGEKYLNISACKVIRPAASGDPAEFPWLNTFLEKVWDENHPQQRDYFLAWLQHFYVSALRGSPQQGHAVFIAGDPSRGKTFLNQRIIGAMMGGFSDPTDFLMGRTQFNKADSEVAHWAIDDTRGASSWENHSKFSAAIKKHVANPQVRCEGKNANAFTIPWNGRIVVTCNTDKESLNILPAANDSILDKIMMFRLGGWQADFLPNRGTEAVVAKELPSFLCWLEQWQPPSQVLSENPRYRVRAYHHPLMLEESENAAPAARLRELLDEYCDSALDKEQRKPQWFTPAKLRKALSQDPSARDSLKEFGRDRMAPAMESLGEDYVIRSRKNGRTTEYLINLGRKDN